MRIAGFDGEDYPLRVAARLLVVEVEATVDPVVGTLLLLNGPRPNQPERPPRAFAERACRSGYSALYVRAPRPFQELAVSRGDGSYARLLARLTLTQLLVIDDWGLAPLKDDERRDLLEVVEDCYDRTSTLITSQLPVKAWHDAIEEALLADAICDRLVHRAYTIDLKSPSQRDPKQAARRSSKAS